MAQHICIQGTLGAGKTFMASTLAHHWRSQVRNLGGDIKLFSNYGLLDSQMMNDYTDWYDVAKAQGSIIVWDEAHFNFDSRQALKGSNISSTKLLIYTRKMKSIQIYCTPSILNIDSRLRQLVEVMINVRPNGNKGINVDFYDYQAKQFGNYGRFIHSKFIPRYKMDRIFKMNLFDSYAMVSGFPMPTTARKEQEFFERLEEIHNQARQKGSVLYA